mgnify:CR=1 FL=1
MLSVKKIIHKHSSVVDKLPRTDELDYGEIAINYASGKEFISLKNADNQIVKITPQSEPLFRYDNDFKNGIVPTSLNNRCQAKGAYCFAVGYSTMASNYASHAEGNGTVASGYSSHAEGNGTVASGDYSHVEGYHTNTFNQSEHASGQYNISTKSTVYPYVNFTLFTIGNGDKESSRHNAFEVKKSGEIFIQKDKVNTSEMISLQDKLTSFQTKIDNLPDTADLLRRMTAMETQLAGMSDLLNRIIGDN